MRERIDLAFHIMDREYGVTRLLDPEGELSVCQLFLSMKKKHHCLIFNVIFAFKSFVLLTNITVTSFCPQNGSSPPSSYMGMVASISIFGDGVELAESKQILQIRGCGVSAVP